MISRDLGVIRDQLFGSTGGGVQLFVEFSDDW